MAVDGYGAGLEGQTASIDSLHFALAATGAEPQRLRPPRPPRGSPDRRRRSPGSSRGHVSFDELEGHLNELEAEKKQQDRRKRAADEEQRKQSVQQKRALERGMQQAHRVANLRRAEVTRLLRQLEQVRAEQERHIAKKLSYQEQMDQAQRRLREESHHVEQLFEAKLAEAGEARGRLDFITWAVDVMAQQQEAGAGRPGQGRRPAVVRAEHKRLAAEAAELSATVARLRDDNGQLRQELGELWAHVRQVCYGRSGAVAAAASRGVAQPGTLLPLGVAGHADAQELPPAVSRHEEVSMYSD